MTDERKAELRLACKNISELVFNAIARTALPELLDEVDRLTAELAAEKRRADAAEEQLRTVNAMIGKVEKPSDTFSTTDGRGVQEGEPE